jgi:hypothetical protein
VSGWLIAALVLSFAGCALGALGAYRSYHAERKLVRARALLSNALAAEQSAYRCREVGAFDRAQRDEIRAFLSGEQS